VVEVVNFGQEGGDKPFETDCKAASRSCAKLEENFVSYTLTGLTTIPASPKILGTVSRFLSPVRYRTFFGLERPSDERMKLASCSLVPEDSPRAGPGLYGVWLYVVRIEDRAVAVACPTT
jgi:hypothetical protein